MARVVLREDVRAHFARTEQLAFDLRDCLHSATCPVLVIAGQDDPITPPECAEEIVAALRPAPTRYELLPDAGHGVLTDAPDTAIHLIRQFVAEPELGQERGYNVASAGL